MAWSNRTKNTSTSTNYLRHGKEPTVGQLADYTFQSVVFVDGTILENVTFAELADAVWSNQSKNTATEGESTNTDATSPGTMANDTSIGTVEWANLDNAKTSDDTYAATFLLISSAISNYLKATNFGFSIPSGATIDGIKVEIEQRIGTGAVIENSIKIVKGGTISGDNKSTGATLPSPGDAYVTYGSLSDLWGLSWTVSDINASDFGVVFATQGDVNGVSDVDHIRITIYYTTASTWTNLDKN